MAGPMPVPATGPQSGGPMPAGGPDEGSQDQPGAAGPAGDAGGKGGSVGDLVNEIHTGLSDFLAVMSKSQVPDEFKQRLDGVVKDFESLISDLSGGGQGGQDQSAPQAPQGAMAPMESGGSDNAKPAY